MSPNTDFLQRYEECGIRFPIGVLSEQEASDYRRKLEDYERDSGGPIGGMTNKKVHLLFSWANKLIRNPRILQEVEKIIGPNIFCWGSEFFAKESKSKNFVSWHQDATYWGLGNDEIVTVWLALSPSTRESGCMRVVPGTHKSAVDHDEGKGKDNLLSRGQEIAVEVEESEAVDVELNPGQASLHHVLIFHGSEPNLSNDRRIGFVARYLPTHLKPQGGEDSATLVQGEDAYRYFNHEPLVERDFEPAMVELHRKLCEQTEKRLGNEG